jgi:hypothetical protein
LADLLVELKNKLEERRQRKDIVLKDIDELHKEFERRSNELNEELGRLGVEVRSFEITVEALEKETGSYEKTDHVIEEINEKSEIDLSKIPVTEPTNFVVSFIKNKKQFGATTNEIFSALQKAGFLTKRKSLHTILVRQKNDTHTIEKVENRYYASEDKQPVLALDKRSEDIKEKSAVS